jgi:hypothetical protein
MVDRVILEEEVNESPTRASLVRQEIIENIYSEIHVAKRSQVC